MFGTSLLVGRTSTDKCNRTGGYQTRGVRAGIFFLLRARLGFTPGVKRLIGDSFWGLRQVPAPPPGLNGGVLGGPLPLKMWILPGQGQGSKLNSRSDGQMINFNRGYLVVEIETQRESSSRVQGVSACACGGSVHAVGLLVCSRVSLLGF